MAKILADFVLKFDAARENCWIAERDGWILGSVFIVKEADTVARLRLLYVEPDARGSGIGRTLVRQCTTFARQAGYERLVLWTQSILVAARRIYEQEGYVLLKSEPHRSFGCDLEGETWELVL
ncbi:MAG TPA: GNAT family N-acetyltransferase [Aestuariivirga sp.]|nr:GNAT family N-acetyltransferase [Aestuariivirga sp.]